MRFLVVLVVVVGVAVMSAVARKRGRLAQRAQAELMGVTGSLTHDATIERLPTDFEVLPHPIIRNALRDRQRPTELFGCQLGVRYRGRRSAVEVVAGFARLDQWMPALELRCEVPLARGREGQLEVGDDDFDDRWVIAASDHDFWSDAFVPELRNWLMSRPNELIEVEFEVSGEWAMARIMGSAVERIPEVMELARTFAEHLAHLPHSE